MINDQDNIEIIKKTVKESGGKTVLINKERQAYVIIMNNKQFIFTRKFGIHSKPISVGALTKYKDLTAVLLQKNNIRTPKFFSMKRDATKEEIIKGIKKLKMPIIIKPTEGSNSVSVYPEISSIKKAVAAIKEIKKSFFRIIAQEMVFGKEYRVLILDGKAIGVLQMVPPFIMGDGKNNVDILIKKMQAKTEKKTPRDDLLKKILNKQKVNLKTILPKNKKVFIRENSCLAEGGISIDCTDKISKKLEKICAEAVRLMGLKLAGIDLICDSIAKDPEKQAYSIIEINGKPDIYIHHNPSVGKKRNVTKQIINYIVKKVI